MKNHTGKKIGGPGKLVEIDESKFGKRKYRIFRSRINVWILGICRESGELFIVECPRNKRDKNTLIPIIRQHVAEGTHIITDCWKAYFCLPNFGYTHSAVNHSKNYVKPNTDGIVHTHGIDGR